jgi:hypothetical protein
MTWQQWLVLGLTFVLGMFLGAAMMAVALVRRIYTEERRLQHLQATYHALMARLRHDWHLEDTNNHG